MFVSNPVVAGRIRTALTALSDAGAERLSIVCVGGEFLPDFPISHVSQNWEYGADAAAERMGRRILGAADPGVRISCVGKYVDRGTVRDIREAPIEKAKPAKRRD